jgi:hypothetical protein
MEANEIPGNLANPPSKPRRLPEVPMNQEPYDVTKVPRKPPRQRPRGQRCSTPDLQRRSSGSSSLHKRSRSLSESRSSTEFRRLSVGLGDARDNPLITQNGNLKHKNVSVDSQGKNVVAIGDTVFSVCAFRVYD